MPHAAKVSIYGIVSAAMLLCCSLTWAESEHIRVGTKLSVPFTVEDSGEWHGLAFNLWKAMATDLNIDYSVKRYATVDELLAAIAQGKVDVGVGSITINAEREKAVDFSHTYFTTGLGIATIQSESGIWASLRSLATAEFFSAVFSLLLVLTAVGVVIWLLERKHNSEQFGGNTAEGIGNGFWWSAVTMTTVGYGDKAPATFFGRVVGVVWMFISVITISSFTAAIASSITVKNLSSAVSGMDDLYRVRVATVNGSSSVDFLQQHDIRFTSYDNVDELVQALAAKQVDAAVYDISLLKYTIKEKGYRHVKVLAENLVIQEYAFAFAEQSPKIEAVNRLLLEKISSDNWQQVVGEYFGDD